MPPGRAAARRPPSLGARAEAPGLLPIGPKYSSPEVGTGSVQVKKLTFLRGWPPRNSVLFFWGAVVRRDKPAWRRR